MSPLPLFRFGSRARSTSIGIALCTMFIVASFSIVGGLKASMDRLEANFSSDYFIVTRAEESGLAPFDPSTVTPLLDECAYGFFVDVTVNTTSRPSSVFYLEDSEEPVFPSVARPVADEVYVPSGFGLGHFTVTSEAGEEQVNGIGLLDLDQFPDRWLLGARDLVDRLSGQAGMANFAITDTLSESQRGHLVSEGFSVQSMTGIIDFLGGSVSQIESDMTMVLIPSAFVIAVLSYGFIGSETADRRHDIGILKTIGAGWRSVLTQLLSSSLLISLWGGLLGLAFGIILSYAISTVASSVFTSVFLMTIDPVLLALALASTLSAGLVGALVPSLKMTMSSPVSDLKEATR